MDRAILRGMDRVREFMERYRAAFVRRDVDGLLDFYGFPMQLVAAGPIHPSVSVVAEEEWRLTVRRLVLAYRRLRVSSDSTGEFEVTRPLPGVASVRARWVLCGSEGEPIYDFTALYTVVDSENGPRIVAIAHDELPKITAALKAR